MKEKLAKAGYAAAQKDSQVRRTAPYGGDNVIASWDMLESWEKAWFLHFIEGYSKAKPSWAERLRDALWMGAKS